MLTGESLIGLVLLPVGLLGLLVIARLLELAGDIGYLLTGSKLLEPSDMEYRSNPLRRATHAEKKAQIQAGSDTESIFNPDPRITLSRFLGTLERKLQRRVRIE